MNYYKITDEIIIKEFIGKNNKINSCKTTEKWLNNHNDLREYLLNRFPKDEWVSFAFCIRRIIDKVEILPTCKKCGKSLFNLKATYCSTKCQLSDPEFISERESKINREAQIEKQRITKLKKKYDKEEKIRAEKELYEKNLVVDDELIKRLYKSKRGIDSNKCHKEYLENNPKIYNYLLNRFEETNLSISEIVNRILNDYDKIKIDDDYIIKLFVRNNNKLKPISKKFLNRNLKIKKYLENRYPQDNFISYTHTIIRIRDGIENLSICPICGEKIYNLEAKWCSTKCASSDKNYQENKFNTMIKNRPNDPYNTEAMIKTKEKHSDEDPLFYKKIFDKCCKTREINYGEPDYMLIGSKSFEDNLENKIGERNPLKNESIKQKMLNTKKEKLKEDPNYFKDSHEKALNTMKRKRPEDPYNKAKRQETLKLKEDSDPNYWEKIILKAKNTRLLKYPDDPWFSEKIKKVKEEKVKKDPLYWNKIREKANRPYLYKGKKFDSSWELAVWIYAEDHNEKIEREPVALTYYKEDDFFPHTYIVDFIYKGKLLEIKGPQHLISKNTPYILKNTYKQSLIEENNITVWSFNEIKPFLDYIKKEYGKTYLQSFRVSKEVK